MREPCYGYCVTDRHYVYVYASRRIAGHRWMNYFKYVLNPQITLRVSVFLRRGRRKRAKELA